GVYAASEAHDAGATVIDFKHLSGPLDAEFRLVEFVDQNCVRISQVLCSSCHEIPWQSQLGVWIQSHHLHRLLPPIGPLPEREPNDIPFCVGYALKCLHLVQLAFAEGHSHLNIRNVLGYDPKVRTRMINQAGGRHGEPDKKAEFHHD